MFQPFITSLDNHQNNIRSKRQECLPSTTKQNRLRQLIKDIVASMINSREICTQAALNIGLSTNILDFQKLIKFINSQANPSTLTFTYMQLKTLQKQSNKLKNAINTPKETPKQIIRTSNRQVTLNPVHEEPSKNQPNSQQRIAKALQQQLAFRIKVKQLNSKDKIERKQEILRKRVEKAKSMNKRALKIYKNHKQQQSKAYDFYKVQPSPDRATNTNKSNVLATRPEQKDQTITLHEESYEIQQKPTCKLLNISIMRDSFTAPQMKSKTAATKMRSKYIGENDSSVVKCNRQRFIQQKKRQIEVRNNKIQLQKSKEEQALYRLIKKQQRLNQIELAHQEQSSKLLKKHQKMRQNQLTSSKIQQIQLKLDSVVKQKCEQKTIQKQMHLQQQVNRIRQQLRIKQQRRQRHRLKKEREHQQQMQQNQIYLKNYNDRYKRLKQNDFRHQMAIKQRHEKSQQRQVFQKIVNNLSKYSDQQLIKSIKKLKNINHSQSLFNLNPN